MWPPVIGIVVAAILFVVGVMVALTYSARVGDTNSDQGILLMRIAAVIAVVSAVWLIGKLVGVV